MTDTDRDSQFQNSGLGDFLVAELYGQLSSLQIHGAELNAQLSYLNRCSRESTQELYRDLNTQIFVRNIEMPVADESIWERTLDPKDENKKVQIDKLRHKMWNPGYPEIPPSLYSW